MGGKKNEASNKKKVKPELRPLITHTEVGRGIQCNGDVEAPNDSQEMGIVGHNRANLSRGKGRTEQRMVEREGGMALTCSSKASEK